MSRIILIYFYRHEMKMYLPRLLTWLRDMCIIDQTLTHNRGLPNVWRKSRNGSAAYIDCDGSDIRLGDLHGFLGILKSYNRKVNMKIFQKDLKNSETSVHPKRRYDDIPVPKWLAWTIICAAVITYAAIMIYVIAMRLRPWG